MKNKIIDCLAKNGQNENITKLRELLEAQATEQEENSEQLIFPIGKKDNGEVVLGDFAKLKNILVGGTTVSGKTLFAHQVILALASTHPANRLQIALVDLKQVEYNFYETLPHLVDGMIIDHKNYFMEYLSELIEEKNYRLKRIEEEEVENVQEYNKKASQNGFEKFKKIVVVVDEFADLMLDFKTPSSHLLIEALKNSTTAGIYFLLMTQHISKNVLVQSLRESISTRLTFKTACILDSKRMIGIKGAEQLNGRGEFLLRDGKTDIIHMTTGYVSVQEINDCVDCICKNND